MTTAVACCDHPTPYRDDDETRCRNCARSISFPARSPGEAEAEEKRLDKLRDGGRPRALAPFDDLPDDPHISCVGCHQRVGWNPDQKGVIVCLRCGIAVAVEDGTGGAHQPPFDPPRLLDCRCCGWDLPQFSYYVHPKQPNREFRFATCKRCCSSQARARRAADPDGYRKRSQEYSRKIQAERVAGERPPVRESQTEDQKERALQATQRYRARSNGRPVPKLKAGGKTIYVTPMCRAVDCPLRLLKP